MLSTKTLAIAAALVLTLLPSLAHAQAVKPNYNPPSGGSEPPCEYGMGYLKRISVPQLGQVDEEWKVWIRPVCENSPHAPVRNMGNATQLIGAIGRNEVLVAALDEKHYLADDVVGVELTKGQRVVLWVHPSLY
jgi:hypothetical protein